MQNFYQNYFQNQIRNKDNKKANKRINPKKKITFFFLKIFTHSKIQNKKTIKINKLDKVFW